MTKTTTAIYARISSDPSGQAVGVDRQIRQALDLADRLGLTVTGQYVDNDVSAYSGKTRPEFERLLDDIADGTIGHLIVWAPDRLYRSTRDYQRVADVVGARVPIHTVVSGDVDLRTPAGTLNAVMLAAVGQFESAHKAERVKARALQRATQEKRTVASIRPFGWQWVDPCPAGDACQHSPVCTEPGRRPRRGSRGGLEPHPVEGPALAQVYRDVAAGSSVYAAHKRLAATVDVGRMTPSTLSKALRTPRHAGLASYRGEVVGEAADGQRIIDTATWQKVAGILSDPARRTSPGRRTATWLGGIVTCGKCGGPMTASTANGRGGDRVPVYRCRKTGCMNRRREVVDTGVLPMIGDVVTELGARGLLAVAPADDTVAHDLRRQIAEHDDRLAQLAALVTDGTLNPVDYAAATARIRADLDTLSAQLAARAARPALAALADAADTRAAWGALIAAHDHDTVHAIVSELVDGITANRDRTLTVNWRTFTGLTATVLPVPEPTIDGRAERRRKVVQLHQSGENISRIAAALGIDRGTVRADLAAMGVYR